MILTSLDDIGAPYSCEQWGEFGTSGEPTIISDGDGYQLYYMAVGEENGQFPVHILITKDREIFQVIEGEPTEVELKAYITLLMNYE